MSVLKPSSNSLGKISVLKYSSFFSTAFTPTNFVLIGKLNLIIFIIFSFYVVFSHLCNKYITCDNYTQQKRNSCRLYKNVVYLFIICL